MANDVKYRDTDRIDFLIASPKPFSCTEAAKVQPETPGAPAQDALTRLHRRPEPGPEARPLAHGEGGVLVLDDPTPD